MLDPTIIGIIIITGSLAGSGILTVFQYFRERKKREEDIAAILLKPEDQRTPEEKFLLETKPQTFFQAYKFRFLAGVTIGFVITLYQYPQAVQGLASDASPIDVFLKGFGLSGIFTALADQIRQT